MSAAFGEEGSKTMVFVAMEDPNGLTPTARQRYGELVSRLQTEGDHVLLVQDLLADPITEAQAVSVDRKAWYLPVGVAGTLGDPTAAESVNAVRDIAAEVFTGSTTTVQVTGPPATFSDMIASAEHDLLLISIATAGVIALILLIVYRSVFTALLPLLVIGLSLAVGRGVLSALGEMGMPVSQFTVAFMTAIRLHRVPDQPIPRAAPRPSTRRSGHHPRHRQHRACHPRLRRHRRTRVPGHGLRAAQRLRRPGPRVCHRRAVRISGHRHPAATRAVASRQTRHR
jgi:hypothetical protein